MGSEADHRATTIRKEERVTIPDMMERVLASTQFMETGA